MNNSPQPGTTGEQSRASFEPGARVYLPTDDGGYTGEVIGPGFIPGEVKVMWDDGLITHISKWRLEAARDE